jgi:hypothetical protein
LRTSSDEHELPRDLDLDDLPEEIAEHRGPFLPTVGALLAALVAATTCSGCTLSGSEEGSSRLDAVESARDCLSRRGFRLNANVPWWANYPHTADAVELPSGKVSHYRAEMGSFTITVMVISFETERSARMLESRLAQHLRQAHGTDRVSAQLRSRTIGRVGKTVLTWWPPSPATRARSLVRSCLRQA